MDETTLEDLAQKQKDVKATLAADPGIIRRFVGRDKKMFQRTIPGAEKRHATVTGFGLYYLVGAGVLGSCDLSLEFEVLPEDDWQHVVNNLLHAVVSQHRFDADGVAVQEEATKIGALPNPYNTSVQLAGLFRSLDALPESNSISNKQRDDLNTLVRWIARKIHDHGGYLPRIESEQAPSAYLTFWGGAALNGWLELSDEHSDEDRALIEDALRKAGDWCLGEASNEVAYHHSGVAAKFDIIETVYSSLGALRFGPDPDVERIVNQALDIVFSSPNFSNGCFAQSAPVLADKDNFSLQCPTAEATALLLLEAPALVESYWQPLIEVYEWLESNYVDNKGWCPENINRFGEPTAFMTCSAVSFLAGLYRLLDDILHSQAAESLGLSQGVPGGWLSEFRYPEEVEDVVRPHIIKPLSSSPPRSKLASYSMLLYGPPGSSKTTIAKKIAYDLSWPIVIVNQDQFLRRGIENIYGEADRLFRLISHLKNTVVLFDEVEELVEDRDSPDKASRFLTTFMLPRIHELRDKERVVFIFATNHQERIDDAVIRLGRFDIIKGVTPPDDSAREEIVSDLYEEFDLSDAIREACDKARLATRTEHCGYMDLYATCRYLKVAVEIEGRDVGEELVDEAISKYGVDSENYSEQIQNVSQSQSRLDRP